MPEMYFTFWPQCHSKGTPLSLWGGVGLVTLRPTPHIPDTFPHHPSLDSRGN